MRLSPAWWASRFLALSGLAVCLGLFAGCSRPTGSVTGKVTYQGKVIKGGTVSFVSTDGNPNAVSEIAEDGTYKLQTVTGGGYKVCVDTSSLKPQGEGMARGGSGPAPKGVGGAGVKNAGPPPDAVVPEGYTPSSPADAAMTKNARRYTAIPDQYGDPAKTDLTYTVTGGSQTHDIELK
ncbi:MAG: hypothetical protein JWO38_3525 [Gemmataceae bacterium]|nr:hypothetical protein [Gemmataceae bacterium]